MPNDATAGRAPLTRPLRADARRNREQVLRAAAELFERDGLGVPLDDIARRAGVGAGTVHRHFPSKDSLIAALVVDSIDRVAGRIRALAGAADPAAALGEALVTMLDEGARSTTLKAALAGTGFDPHAAAPDLVGGLRDGVDRLLARAQAGGGIRTDIDVTDVMALVAGAFAAIQQTGGDPARAGRITQILLDGLHPPQASTRAIRP